MYQHPSFWFPVLPLLCSDASKITCGSFEGPGSFSCNTREWPPDRSRPQKCMGLGWVLACCRQDISDAFGIPAQWNRFSQSLGSGNEITPCLVLETLRSYVRYCSSRVNLTLCKIYKKTFSLAMKWPAPCFSCSFYFHHVVKLHFVALTTRLPHLQHSPHFHHLWSQWTGFVGRRWLGAGPSAWFNDQLANPNSLPYEWPNIVCSWIIRVSKTRLIVFSWLAWFKPTCLELR